MTDHYKDMSKFADDFPTTSTYEEYEDSNSEVEDEGSGSEEESCDDVENDISECFVPEPAITKPAPKGLHELSAHEPLVTGGIHLFHGVEAALKKTFPGWPNAEYAAFRVEAERLLTASKKLPLPKFVEVLKAGQYKQTDTYLQAFMDNSPNFKGKKDAAEYHRGVLKVMVRGVKYLDEVQRKKYLITLGSCLMRGSEIFDTKLLVQTKQRSSVGGTATSGYIMERTMRERCAWVMTENDYDGIQFYSHFGKLARFHHSSFNGGREVLAAGEWYVEQGKIKLINSLSGHYRPTEEMFLYAVDYLLQQGAVGTFTQVVLFEKQKDGKKKENRDYDAVEFKNDRENILGTLWTF